MINIEEPYYSTGRESTDLDDYVSAVARTISFWLLIHFSAQWWAEFTDLFGDGERYVRDPKRYSLYNGSIVDLTPALARFQAEENGWKYYYCPECGLAFDLVCDECGAEDLEEYTGEDLDELLGDLFYGTDWDSLSRDVWVKALVSTAFPAYREAVKDDVSVYQDAIMDSILDIISARNSDDNAELLAAVMAATQVYHVNGELISDYGDMNGIEYWLVDVIRNDGFEEHFGEEEVQNFLENPAPDLYLPADLIEVIRKNGDDQELDRVVKSQVNRRTQQQKEKLLMR